MVPEDYIAYFTAAATAAGALIGLLFVAITLRPQTIFGAGAAADGRTLAATAFNALVNAFIVSLVALMPRTNLGYAAIVMGLVSLWATVRLVRSTLRQTSHVIMLIVSLATFTTQVVLGCLLIAHPHDVGHVDGIADITIAAFAVALARAWALVRGEHLPESEKADRAQQSPGGSDTTS